MRILFSGGGTGGHFFPIIAVAREIKKIAEEERILDVELFYMGPSRFGSDELKKEDILSIPVTSGKIRRYFSLQNIFDIFKIFFGVVTALWKLFWIMPDVIFLKGGYGSFPALIAAYIYGIPLMIHDSDSIPGMVSKLGGRFAKRIGIAFPMAAGFFPDKKVALVGIPLRKGLFGGTRNEAEENFNVFSGKKCILVMGGSQGAEALNDAVLGVIKDLTDEFEIIHQAGKENLEEVRLQASELLRSFHKERYHLFGFLNENAMRDAYLLANLIVSRAGATSIFEIANLGKPSILIPLKNSAQDHQRENAYSYVESGACVILEESNLTPHLLLGEIKRLMENPEKMRQMGEAAKKFARPDSAELIAREILKLGIH